MKTTDERPWDRIQKSNTQSCWLWTGCLNRKGYGQLTYKGGRELAHRLVWKLTNGPIPKEMLVCHTCDVPACCNPSHLFLGTPAENTKDMMQKQRNRNPWGEHTGTAKLTEEQVVGVMARLLTDREKHTHIASSLNVTVSAIRDIWYGRRWNKLFHPFKPYNRNMSYPQNRNTNITQNSGPSPRPR